MIDAPNGTFIGDDSRANVYVMTCDHKLTAQQCDQIRAGWDTVFKRAGMIPPVCMVLDAGLKLSRLEPAESDHLVPGAEYCAA